MCNQGQILSKQGYEIITFILSLSATATAGNGMLSRLTNLKEIKNSPRDSVSVLKWLSAK